MLSPIERAIAAREGESGATPRGHEIDMAAPKPGVLAPIEPALALRGSDEGATPAPVEQEDDAANRATDADQPQSASPAAAARPRRQERS